MSGEPYAALLGRLFGLQRFGVDLGLARVERALAALDHPEMHIGTRVHIGGTNGKGSTAAMVAAIARQSGTRTGRYASPHLTQLGERFVIDGQPASPAAIVAAADRVAACGAGPFTFFEEVTLIGLCLFAQAEIDLAVLEVGLGGRLDATNAVPAEIAVVTGVAFDHQAYLGDTLAEIAGEKAGIFKPGQDVIIGRAGLAEAVPHLLGHARAAGAARVIEVGADALPPADWTLGLAGLHQRSNAACALAVIEALRERGLLAADRATCRAGLAAVRLPGRMDTVGREPLLVIDGAHNPHAAAALARAVEALPEPRVLLVAIASDKDIAGILKPLVPRVSSLVATRYAGPRGSRPDDLAAAARQLDPQLECWCEPSVARAVERARDRAGRAGAVIAAGSLYLAGEVRQVVCGDPADPLAVSDPLGSS